MVRTPRGRTKQNTLVVHFTHGPNGEAVVEIDGFPKLLSVMTTAELRELAVTLKQIANQRDEATLGGRPASDVWRAYTWTLHPSPQPSNADDPLFLNRPQPPKEQP